MESVAASASGISRDERQDDIRHRFLFWSSPRYYNEAITCWSVGIFSVWRFNMRIIEARGTVFVLPYFISMFLLGIPLTFMQMALGQYSEKGPVGMWCICPLLKGVGVANVFLLVITQSYYNMICSYALHYTVVSFGYALPWSTCGNTTVGCYILGQNRTYIEECYDKYGKEFCNSIKWEHSSQHYYINNILKASVFGVEVDFYPAVTSLFVFLITCRARMSIEKVLTFMTIYPYITLLILLIVTFISEGSSKGYSKLIETSWEGTLTVYSWTTATKQIFMTMGLGLGGLTTLGSQASFRNNCLIQAVHLNLLNFMTSICYTTTMLGILGCLAHSMNTTPDSFLALQQSFLFSLMPLGFEALMWHVPQLWSFLFYSGVLIFGLRSQVLMNMVIFHALCDSYPKCVNYPAVCMAMYSIAISILNLVIIYGIDAFIIILIDNMVAGAGQTFLIALSTVAVVFIYGVITFTDDVHFMLGIRPSLYFQLCWFLSPFVLVVMYAYVLYETQWYLYIENIPSLTIQLSIVILPPLTVIFGVFVQIIRNKRRKCKKLLRPTDAWGPTDTILVRSRRMFAAHNLTKEYVYRQERATNKIKALEDSSSDSDY